MTGSFRAPYGPALYGMGPWKEPDQEDKTRPVESGPGKIQNPSIRRSPPNLEDTEGLQDLEKDFDHVYNAQTYCKPQGPGYYIKWVPRSSKGHVRISQNVGRKIASL